MAIFSTNSIEPQESSTLCKDARDRPVTVQAAAKGSHVLESNRNFPTRIAWPAGRPRRVSAHLPRPIHSAAARLTTALPISSPRWPYPIASEISNLKPASMVATFENRTMTRPAGGDKFFTDVGLCAFLFIQQGLAPAVSGRPPRYRHYAAGPRHREPFVEWKTLR